MLEFQPYSPSVSSEYSFPSLSSESPYQNPYRYSRSILSSQADDSESGSVVMTDRRWMSLQEEGLQQQEQEEQQLQQQQAAPPPITLPLVQAQQHPTLYHPSASSMPAHLQAATSAYPTPSIYPSIEPALAAGYYQYGQSYGTPSAFRFPPPHEHFQHQQPFSSSTFPFGRSSFIGDMTRSSSTGQSSFQRPKLHQIGRTFSSPEMPTPPPTMMSAAFSAPASAGLFPPPPPSGQHTHSFGSAGRTTSSGTVHSFFDPYHASVSGFLLHHHQQQQQHPRTPSPSSEGHSPSTSAAGMSAQAMPLLSPFGYVSAWQNRNDYLEPAHAFHRDASFMFQSHAGSPLSLAGHSPQAHGAGLAGQQHPICAVCGDTAACLHYGVRTCEGCKGFFKRTVQKNAKYVCLGNRDCIVDKRRRNRCQFCRYQKCLNVGMVKEVVRTDSLKGRRGRLPSKSKITGSGDEAGPSGIGGLFVAQSLTKALVNAFTGTGAAHLPMSTVRLGSSDQLIDSLRVSLQAVHQYTEQLPGWTGIAEVDRVRLLKRFGIHTLSLRWAYRSMAVACDEKLLSDDGLVYALDECPLAWQTWFQAVLTLSAHFRSSLDLDVTSFSCLLALSLVFQASECPGIERVEEVDKLKNNIINCLKEHCAYSTEAKAKPQYFARILSVLNDLNTISQYARQAYAATFGDIADLEDRPSTSSLEPLSLTFFDESFLD